MKVTRFLGTDRYSLDERQRFYLLLTIFNVMLVLIMVLLSLRQRLVQRVEFLEVEVTRVVVERLACETESAAIVAMISRTPTVAPPTAPAPTGTPTPTEIPTSTPTNTPTPTRAPTYTPTPTSTDTPTPTRMPTSTRTPTPTDTPVAPTSLPPPTVLGIMPDRMVRSDSGPPVTVVITGSNFFGRPTADLGFVSVTILDADTTDGTDTITGNVPISMGTGIYNLTVTNPDTQSDTLERAFTVTEPVDPDKTLECSHLVTYGSAGDLTDGDDDHVQLIFFDMPDTVTDDVYIRVYDPDTGGALDRFKESVPSWDTAVRFSVYGGPGAYSDPAARVSHPVPDGIGSGVPLATDVFSENVGLDQNWYAFGHFAASAGEHVGDRYVFKLAVVGEGGNDGNLYNVALSISPDTNAAPPGARIFAFSWTFALTDTARPALYPYLDTGVTTFTQHNCDYDYSDGTMTIRTPEQELQVGGGGISGNGDCRSLSFDVGIAYTTAETGTSWAVDFRELSFTVSDNDVTFWATRQGDIALPVFTIPGTWPPP